MPFIGEFVALFTAFLWALSVVFFRKLGGAFSPLVLNFWKGILSVVGITAIVLALGNPFPSERDTLWLILSGVVGIGIGDTAFFAALNRMGERATLLMAETMAPIFTALLAMAWLAEWLTWQQWLAIGVIILGVDIVVRARKGKRKHIELTLSGFSFAAIAAMCQAVGAVIGRDILVNSQVDAITASLIRLAGGLFLIVPLIVMTRSSWLPKPIANVNIWPVLCMATFIGTFLAMMAQMFAFANAEAAIVQSLFASCIIFSLIIAYFQGEKVTMRAVLGSLIAIVGVCIVFIAGTSAAQVH